MQIKRLFNNNAIVFINKKGQEEIALGKGIGYQKKIGDMVDESKITKVFVLKDESTTQKLEQLLKDIPIEYIQLASDIMQEAQTKLHVKLSDILIISLSDHIYSSIQRMYDGLSLKNDLLWEIQRFYADEYEIGVHALESIKERFNISLLPDEAGFIAMHLINAEVNEGVPSSMNAITKIIQDICNIVRRFFQIEFDPSSVYYYRFMTHLKFFSERMLKGNAYENDSDSDLLEVLKVQYQNSYQCVEKIKRYLKEAYNYHMSDEEETYLIIHIQKVVYKTTRDN